MGDSEASSSPLATKRPAEGDPGGSGQTPAPKQAKLKKSNSTSIHEEYTRYTYTDRGGKQRTGSRCKECHFEMKDINPTNLKFHVQRKHPDIYDRVIGKSHHWSISIFSFSNLISARDKAHQDTFQKSIKPLGISTTASLLVPPEVKGKGKAQVWSQILIQKNKDT